MAQPKISETALVRSICRESYSDFVRMFWSVVNPGTPLLWNWHIELMCDECQKIMERIFRGGWRDYDLVINLPPGSSKSTVFSIMPTAWAWTRMPHFRFINACHSESLALDLALKARDVVTSGLYQRCFPEVQIRSDANTKEYFQTTSGGSRVAVGSRGQIMGRHAHILSVDDPIDPVKAISEAEMNAVNHWIKHVLSTRKTDKLVSTMWLVMQRLHQDDPSAQKLTEKQVRHIRLPATLQYKVNPPGLAANYVGGYLDPVRLNQDVLDRELDILKEWGFASQYGQDPVPLGGGTFKVNMIQWGEPPSHFNMLVRFWDKAATQASVNKRAAWTVGVKLGRDAEGRFWVLDVVRGRWDSFTRERVIYRTTVRDGHECIVGQEQEPGSGGKDSALGTARRLAGYRVRSLLARGNKEIRADEFSVQVNAGNVWLPNSLRDGTIPIGWAHDYLDEMRHWPYSTYKDQVDASAGGFSLISQGKIRVGPLREHPGLPVVGLRSALSRP